MTHVGVGVVGFGWMGQVHARAYQRLLHHYPAAPVRPTIVAVSDPEPARLSDAVQRHGVETTYVEWSELVADPRVQLVSVTAPNFLHREVAVAAARAGRHLWIEKPVGVSAADAQAVAEAVARAGVSAAVGFNYRNAPAVAHARALLAEDRIGRVTHARFRFLSDYAAHPSGALSWRFERARGGSGVLGDLMSHGVDLVHHLLGDITSLVADSATVIVDRPRPGRAQSHFDRAEGGELAPVENEDVATALLRCASGARVTLEGSRVSVGEQNSYGFEIHGTTGALMWDFRRMGELQVSLGTDYQDQSFTTVYAGAGHGEFAPFQPGAGIAMSFDDLKVIELAQLVDAMGSGPASGATVVDAVRAARALEAMAESARTGRWVSLPPG